MLSDYALTFRNHLAASLSQFLAAFSAPAGRIHDDLTAPGRPFRNCLAVPDTRPPDSVLPTAPTGPTWPK